MIFTIEQMKVLLSELAEERPLFHSEADFKHALAWKMHQKNPKIRVRLEKREELYEDIKSYFDIILELNKAKLAIELKYKTKNGEEIMSNGEMFKLKNHQAHDLGRYDFLKDLMRLEKLREKNSIRGYAIFLTNDPSYWNKPKSSKKHIDEEFHLFEGNTKQGTLKWLYGPKPGTTKGRDKKIKLIKKYKIKWYDYSVIEKTEKNNLFRYAILKV